MANIILGVSGGGSVVKGSHTAGSKKKTTQKTCHTQKLVLFLNLFASKFYSNANTNSGMRHVVFAPDNPFSV